MREKIEKILLLARPRYAKYNTDRIMAIIDADHKSVSVEEIKRLLWKYAQLIPDSKPWRYSIRDARIEELSQDILKLFERLT